MTRMEYSMQMLPLCYCYTKYREEIRDSLRRNVTKGDFALGWDDIRMYSKAPTFFFFFFYYLKKFYIGFIIFCASLGMQNLQHLIKSRYPMVHRKNKDPIIDRLDRKIDVMDIMQCS